MLIGFLGAVSGENPIARYKGGSGAEAVTKLKNGRRTIWVE
jgi:hypothetical protein